MNSCMYSFNKLTFHVHPCSNIVIVQEEFDRYTGYWWQPTAGTVLLSGVECTLLTDTTFVLFHREWCLLYPL